MKTNSFGNFAESVMYLESGIWGSVFSNFGGTMTANSCGNFIESLMYLHIIDSGLIGLTVGGFRESRRCLRDTYPGSYTIEYTLVYEDKHRSRLLVTELRVALSPDVCRLAYEHTSQRSLDFRTNTCLTCVLINDCGTNTRLTGSRGDVRNHP